MKIRYRQCAAVILTAALFFLGQALWVPVKAELGQWLLERSWSARLAGEGTLAPWPWADTEPVAVLEIPRLELRQLVLQGASARNLAWGPASLTPVSGRDIIVSGHRDTHFRGLTRLQPGDLVRMTDEKGTREYRVTWLDIIDSRHQEIVIDSARERLTLVTCYPPDAPLAGGPLRLVVTAVPASAG